MEEIQYIDGIVYTSQIVQIDEENVPSEHISSELVQIDPENVRTQQNDALSDDEQKLMQLLKEFDLEEVGQYLKAAQVTYKSLRYLRVDDIKEAILPLGLRAEFREKLFMWRKKEFGIDDETMSLPTKVSEWLNNNSTFSHMSSQSVSNVHKRLKNLAELLQETSKGRSILEFYKKNQHFGNSNRDELINIVVEEAIFNDIMLSSIGDLIPVGNEHWGLFILLSKIITFLLKSEYLSNELTELENLIHAHHAMYIKLYGSLKPKHHFLLHYATAIRKCGPLKYIWCMRFEAKHKEAKMYFSNIMSRVNPPYSLTIKSGIKFSKFLLDHENSIEPYFSFKKSHILDLRNEAYFSEIVANPDIDLTKAEIVNELNYKGTQYKSNFYLATVNNNVELYKTKLYLHQNSNIFVMCYPICLNNFSEHFQSFEVNVKIDKIVILNISSFVTPPLHLYSLNNGKTYVKIKTL